MANRVWRGGNGLWFDPSQWQTLTAGAAASYPLPGDTATIASGDADLVGPTTDDNGVFDDVAVTLGMAGGPAATLTATNAILGSSFSIDAAGPADIIAMGRSTIDGAVTAASSATMLTLGSVADGGEAGDLVFGFGASLTLGGTQTLDLTGGVTFEAASGFTAPATVSVVNDGVVEQIGTATDIAGSLSGSGSWNLDFSTSLLLNGSVSAGQSFTFGLDGRLRLADPGAFAGTVTGFTPGNLIDFTTVSASNASYNAATKVLTLNDGAGSATLAQIANVSAASGALVASPDGSGGTVVSYAGTESREGYEIAAAADALGANIVHGTFVPGSMTPITGAGVKVGIISNSFDVAAPGSANADARAGYLPETANGQSAVTVLGDGPAGSDDEGRAMAELIYQAAPGAQLYFDSSGTSEATFAASINALVAAGCNIIVDDISFAAAPFYQVDGTVDAAVSAAVASGVNYFTSAGNFGDAFISQSFTPGSAPATLYDGTVASAQMFDNGTPYESITVPAGVEAAINLQWTAAYEGANNAGAPDALTFKVFDATGRLVATSAQVVDGVPTTDITAIIPSAAAAATYQLAVYLNERQATPSGFTLVVSAAGGTGTGPGGEINDPQAGTGNGDANGQALIAGVNTVGAVYYGDSAPFGQVPDATEPFSDAGPGTLLFSPTGQALASPAPGGKVDFVAPDGVNTPVPAIGAFFGTSAAAPDAAAVAALVLQAEPGLSTSQVSAALAGSAVSLGLAAAVQGAGLIQAPAAVALAEGVACYCRGTLILTDGGERPIETLAAGDRVVTVSGAVAPVVWVGWRSYAGRVLAGNRGLLPVRIAAGAIGPGVPRRDLRVSPEHAMLIDGVLIPAAALVNGRTITQEAAVGRVEYFHVELPQHDAVWAEGAAAESFVDNGSYGLFANARERPVGGEAVFCAPRVLDGFALEGVRRRLAARPDA